MPEGNLTAPRQARLDARHGRLGSTRGIAPGFVQCNLVIVREDLASEFQRYCEGNSTACPVLEICPPGDPEPKRLAPGADLRTDLPRYAIYRKGVREEDRDDIVDLWEDGFVSFLIGSGISFDHALQQAGIPIDRHRWVLRTTTPTEPAGRFHGNLIVTMRWLTPEHAKLATEITSRFPAAHGAPIHVGDPASIGADLPSRPS